MAEAFSWELCCSELQHSLDATAQSRVHSFSTENSVRRLVTELQHEHAALAKHHVLSRLERMTSTIKPIAIAADTLSRGRAIPSCFFWGLLGSSITVSAPRSEFVEVTLRAFESLLSVAPRFETYLELLPESPALRIAIQDVFQAYISLSRRCLKTFGAGFNFLRQLKWIRYQRTFEDTLRRLRKQTDAVHAEAGIELERKSSQLAEERHSELVARQQEVLSVVTKNLGALEIGETETFLVPHPPNPSFTGRERELEEMHQALCSAATGTSQCQKVVAICGLGGVGKSQLALKYAYDHRDDYKACFWITCDSAVKMDGDITNIAKNLGFPNLGLHQNRERLMDWFSSAGGDWLLIFDNTEKISELFDFWPRSSAGHIILTSQSSSWLLKENVNHGIALKSLTDTESLELLQKTMAKHGETIDPDAATSLVKETGGLPLAIRHIGSYICAMRSDPLEFLDNYQDETEASLIDAWDESAPPWYTHTLSTFLNRPFEHLTAESICLLSIIIFLDPEAISEELFLQEGGMYGPFMSKNKYNLAVRSCIRYDFLSRIRYNNSNALSIHRQVRKYLRHKCNDGQIREGFQLAFQRLRQVFPHQSALAEPLSTQWQQCALWIEHLIAFCDGMLNFIGVLDPPVEIAPLLVDGAIYLWERGLLAEGRNLTLAAKRIVESKGCDERILADVYSFHACILSESGDLHGAKEYFEKQVEKRKERLQKIQREKEPRDKYSEVQLANAYNNLAGACCALEEYGDAEAYNELSLRIKTYWEKELDMRYLQSLSYQNIATLYGRTGRFDEAVVSFEKAISLGENTKYTLRWALTFHNYGCMELSRAQVRSARHQFEKAYELRQASLGDHYDTAATLHMLACCYSAADDKPSRLMARDLLFEAIRILESKSCNSDSRRIARSKFKLSIVLSQLGEPEAPSLRAEAQRMVADVGEACATEEAFDTLVSYV